MANRRLTFGLVGGTLGTTVGLVIGLLVVRNDAATPPRTELVPVSLPSASTTAAPTPPTGDSPLAVAPSDTSMGSSTTTEATASETSTPTTVAITQCEEYARLPEGLPVQICDRSETVRLVQEMLSALGYQIVADGVFGPGTARTVIEYQSSHGLTANGVVDGTTFDSLCANSPVDFCGDA